MLEHEMSHQQLLQRQAGLLAGQACRAVLPAPSAPALW